MYFFIEVFSVLPFGLSLSPMGEGNLFDMVTNRDHPSVIWGGSEILCTVFLFDKYIYFCTLLTMSHMTGQPPPLEKTEEEKELLELQKAL